MRGLAASAIVGAASGWPRIASAGELTEDEKQRLIAGEVVRRPIDAERDEGTYIGGVSYAVIDAPAPYVIDMLRDPATYLDVLPLTLEAKQVGKRGDDMLVFFKHGGRLGTASYTMRVRFASPTLIRFWMDPDSPHEIEDIWGYARAEPLSAERCLGTYAVLADVGTITRLLFGEKIRDYALDTPGNLRRMAGARYGFAGDEP